MNDIESRLADAMAARAREFEPQDEGDALSRISERVNMNRRRGLTVLGIAAALAIVVGAVSLLRDDKGGQNVNIDQTATTNPPTTANTTPASVIPSGPTPIWPFASMNRTFSTPEEAAKSFAVDYLGMTHARLGKTTNGDVEVFPNDRGSARTVVHLEEQPPRGWVVLGANADQIVVVTPKPHDALTSPLTVSGQSTAFEATLAVELRPYGSTNPEVKDIAMGGSNGTIGPFTTSITPPSTDQPLVLVLFEGDASGEQTMTKATVIPLDGAGAKEPAQFVAVTAFEGLGVFDFSGREQRSLSNQAAQMAYSPSAALVAYTYVGDSCAIDFVSLSGAVAPDRILGHSPVFNADGAQVAYTDCDGRAHVRTLATGSDNEDTPSFVGHLPSSVTGTVPTLRGRFGTVAFFDGTDISSYNPANGDVVKLVQPAAAPISLDADESGRFLLWVDVNHDLWKWSGADPVKVGTGFNSAAW